MEFKETETQAKQLPHLPKQIIEDILKRLPVESLVRFSCTCKRWFSLIFYDSKFNKALLAKKKFNKAHIDHAKRPSWKFLQIHDLTDDLRMITIDCDFNVATLRKETTISYLRRAVVLGSCNGLLFVQGFDLSWSKRERVLWNPYTNSIKRIDAQCKDVPIMSGLSYDRASDDYKAIVMLNESGKFSAYVFSLRRNSWKKLSDLTFDFARKVTKSYEYAQGITLDNGICHWQIELKHERFSIICFDPVVEKFEKVPLPADNLRSSTSGLLGSLDGCLSLIDNNTVWVMKDFQSWTKLYVLKLSKYDPSPTCISYKPVGYNSSKDEVVISCGGDLLRFLIGDVNEGGVRNLTNMNRFIVVSTDTLLPFTESLQCPWLFM